MSGESNRHLNKKSVHLLLGQTTYILIYIQQDATLHSLFISGNCSICLGWYPHPSSGAHTTVSTAPGTKVPDAVDTVMCALDDGWRYHPKHVEQFTDINKLYNVASCWKYFRIYLRCTDPYTLNFSMDISGVKNGKLNKPLQSISGYRNLGILWFVHISSFVSLVRSKNLK